MNCSSKCKVANRKYEALTILFRENSWANFNIFNHTVFVFRFLPDGTYLNAKEIAPEKMANKMNEIIRDKQKYYDFFKFHRYYTYQATAESVDTDPLCAFCAFINDESRRNSRRTYTEFYKWWHKTSQQKNETENMIVKYENSGPHIKGIITYRYKNIEKKEFVTPSTIDTVGNFFDDIINYYFPSK